MFNFNVFLISCSASLYCVFVDGNNDGLYSLVSSDQHTETPRLEDFFWTGSGDGPPAPVEAPRPSPTEHSTLVRTTTVLATVYLDSYPPQAVTDKTTGDCVSNCGDVVPDGLSPEVPDDRRYWLLTVIQGSAPDSLQVKLARLYQKAFLRQQERHLGIIKSLDAPTARKKHEVHSFAVNIDQHIIESSYSNVPDFNAQTAIVRNVEVRPSKLNNTDIYLANVDHIDINDTEEEKAELNEVDTWVLVTPTAVVSKREATKEAVETSEMLDLSLEADVGNESQIFKREIIKPEQQPPVHVYIQNITEYPETGAVQIVYVVMVGGRAVPAAVAARDMRLVRDAEVAKELGAVVTTKAEPYLKAAEGLAGEEPTSVGIQGAELWALAIGAAIAVLLLVLLIVLMCRLARRKKSLSAASLRAYRDELIREVERNRLKQMHDEKDGKLISVVSPSRTRPSSTMLPVYRASSVSSTSTTSEVSEVTAANFRRKHKKPHGLRIPQKKRVGTTDSLLAAAGVESSDSARDSGPPTPTSYLSMPSVRSFPRGNVVEPLSKVLEPISVRHLDIDSDSSPKPPPAPPRVVHETRKDSVQRRQMASQLVRLGSLDKDPGVIGPLVWDLHCQRIKEGSPEIPSVPPASRLRRRFTELVEDARALLTPTPGHQPPSSQSGVTFNTDGKGTDIAQARNENVRIPDSTRIDPVRGRSATDRATSIRVLEGGEVSRPRTSFSKPPTDRRPVRAWDTAQSSSTTARLPPVPSVNPAFILSPGRLAPDDPALPLISAIKSEIQRVRDNAQAHAPTIDKV